MAGIVLVGVPFLTGQIVGTTIDVALASSGRSIWPFHGLWLGLAVLVGFRGHPAFHDGAPSSKDYEHVMKINLLVGLNTSFFTCVCLWLIWAEFARHHQ